MADRLLIGAVAHAAISFGAQILQLAVGRSVERCRIGFELLGATTPRGQAHDQVVRYFVGELTLDALLEQSPFERVGELRLLVKVEAQ
ncbi:MAG TPA: hypothetical protein VMF89_09295 [Polyangiales bacterium]|nr:hypothetical protein [Polyangiales bacterium]